MKLDYLLKGAEKAEKQEVIAKQKGDRLTEDILHRKATRAWELYIAEWHRHYEI